MTSITITYDDAVCTHAANCVRSLPAVFDADRSPWIEPNAAPVEDVVAAVEGLPIRRVAIRAEGEAALNARSKAAGGVEPMRKHVGLEYEDIGDGSVVLLIHGGMFAGAFAPLTREAGLVERYRLIRYHRRGFAGSDGFAGPFSIQDQARDALALLGRLGVEQAHVVGHSYGGAVAVELALEAAHVVRSLVLLEPALYGMNPDWRARHAALFDPLVALHRTGETRRAGRAFMRSAEGADWKEGVEAAMPGGVEQVEHDAATFFDVELPAIDDWTFDSVAAKRIAQPVLYVTGADLPPAGTALKAFFCSCVPQTECVVIPGANHSLHHREPTIVAAEIVGFLDRRP